MTDAVLGHVDARHEVERIVAAAGSSFAAGMRVLPRARRRAIFAVYAFCRVVDDIADDPGSPTDKLAALERWSAEVDEAAAGRPATAIGSELARAIPDFDLPPAELHLVVDGMRMDVAGIVAPPFAELERYVRRVAGAVGILSMRIFGAWRGPASDRFALALARGVQLVNILRDVEEDARIGRLYLPREILQAAGLPNRPRGVAGHRGLPAARRLVGEEARASFDAARAEIAGHDRTRLVPALLMMGPYERLLSRMEADWTRLPGPRAKWLKALDGVRCAALGGR
jgi:phytoene synthase